jgi:ATPase family associated with various cellular activities (AAA)
MTAPTPDNWEKTNQCLLMAAIAGVREALAQCSDRANAVPGQDHTESNRAARSEDASSASWLNVGAAATPPVRTAVANLCEIFSLSPFERDILLLCAGVELDSAFPTYCAAASGDPRKTYPTFGLALAALPEPHWSALLPVAPLRHWRLIELGAGDSMATSPLRIDERILHYLTGISYLDQRLHGLLQPVPVSSELVPSHQSIADQLTRLWSEQKAGEAIELFGNDDAAMRTIPAVACAALKVPLHAMRAVDVPTAPSEREALIHLWERESLLSSCVLMIECDRLESCDAAQPLVERIRSPLVITAREPLRDCRRPLAKIEVRKPTLAEQDARWREALQPLAADLNGSIEQIASQFDFDTQSIGAVSEELSTLCPSGGREAGARLWEICRHQSRRRLDGLAERIESVSVWDDLVLPEPQRQVLRQIAVHVRHRTTVHEHWGFSRKSGRGLGISALFSGASGTGKTMAAEVLANELALDLFRIDLSAVMSKYIGETEKNLSRIFDSAEGSGAILLFDEADALFGKRSEVKDSHDRYANIEISYLLQRMESYRGLAILTTNMKSALDPAFLRRIRFAVQFPFPDAAQRAEIWTRIFPAATPTDGLDIRRLARLSVPGGNIRNIALRAAFLAAADSQPVRMTDLLNAARSEYAKIEQPLSEAEIGGWT